MRKTVADKNGGVHVDLSLEEEKSVRNNWAKNEAAQAAKEIEEAAEKALADEAFAAMTDGLPEKYKIVLRNMFNG